jgi:hypothetical protein
MNILLTVNQLSRVQIIFKVGPVNSVLFVLLKIIKIEDSLGVKSHKKTIDWLNIYFGRLYHNRLSIVPPDHGIICQDIYWVSQVCIT